MVASARRIGWEVPSPFHLLIDGGRMISLDEIGPRDVQMLAGHSSLAVTQRYIEGDGHARVKVVDLI